MSFLIAPGGNLDCAPCGRIGVDHTGRFQRIDDPERPIEPPRKILTFEMRARQQLRPGLRARAKHISDAVNRPREPSFRKPLHKPG